MLVDLNSVRSTAIALHRNLQRSAEFEGLPVVYLQGPGIAAGRTQRRPAGADPVARRWARRRCAPRSATFIATPPPARSADAGGGRAVRRRIRACVELAPPKPAPAPTLKGRVLLVEDNPINQKVAQSLIKLLGLECDTADNGEHRARAHGAPATSTWC